MLHIYIGNNEIDANYIMGLTQKCQAFNNSFVLGSTLCRTFNLNVSKEIGDVPSIGTMFTIYEDTTKYATVFVDDVNVNNEKYYSITLADKMVQMNKKFEYDITRGYTVAQLIGLICADHNITSTLPTEMYMSDMVVVWDAENLTQRNFISYVAEVNCGYAYIDADGNLVVAKYTTTPKATIDVVSCSSFKVGSTHKYDKVYLDYGASARIYPEEHTYDTLYLNSENMLFTDSGNYPVDSAILHIYNEINGFEFVDVSANKCPIPPNAKTCDFVSFVLGEDVYNTIWNIDYNFSGHWIGGFKLELDNATEYETQVPSVDKVIKGVKISVNRELGKIEQAVTETQKNVDDLETSVTSRIEQTAGNILLEVQRTNDRLQETNDELTRYETSVSIQSDGVRISQGTEGSYSMFTDNGMDIYVNGQRTAWANADGFSATELMLGQTDTNKWHIYLSNNNNTLTFLRR